MGSLGTQATAWKGGDMSKRRLGGVVCAQDVFTVDAMVSKGSRNARIVDDRNARGALRVGESVLGLRGMVGIYNLWAFHNLPN